MEHGHNNFDRWGGKKRRAQKSQSQSVSFCHSSTSPAAQAAAETKASVKLFSGAAGVSSEKLDNAKVGRRAESARYKSNSLFSNMSYLTNPLVKKYTTHYTCDI